MGDVVDDSIHAISGHHTFTYVTVHRVRCLRCHMHFEGSSAMALAVLPSGVRTRDLKSVNLTS
jgi:hypothetical protein